MAAELQWHKANRSVVIQMIFGIQGGQGSFNEEAVRHYIQAQRLEKYEIKYLYTSQAVMEALVRGEIDRGQCAIYNSTGGYVEETTEALEKFPVKVVEEFEIQIAHAMMIRPDARFEDITTLMAHPQVFAQCKKTLAARYPQLKQMSGEGEWVDNAKAAEALALGQLPGAMPSPDQVAVMGSKVLADIYGLRVVVDNLQDLRENQTRFVHVERV